MSRKVTGLRPGYMIFLPLFLILLMMSGCQRQAEVVPTETATVPAPPSPTETAVPASPTATAETTLSEPAVEEQPASGLTDTLWVLVAYGDPALPVVIEEDTLVTALFDEDGRVSGSGGCNNYQASFEATASGALSVNTVLANLTVCERGMAQEQGFLAALPTARQYTFDERNRLQIAYDGDAESGPGVMTFVQGEVPLLGTPWTLIAFGDPEQPPRVEAGTAITALFAETGNGEGVVSGYGGCNEYTASFSYGDETLAIRNPVATRKGCPMGVNQEAAYLQALGTTHTYRIIGQRLEVDYDRGVLIYTAGSLPLTNTLWRLVAVDREAVPETVPIFMLFEADEAGDGGILYGVAGCAVYQSIYQRAENGLRIAPAQITGTLCPEPQAYEARFLAALTRSSSFAIYGEQMALETADGQLAFAANRAPLERVVWDLMSFGRVTEQQALPEGLSMRMFFVRSPDRPSGLMVGETNCNSFTATFAAGTDEIGINEPVTTAGQACTAEQLAQEEQLFRLLTTAGQFRLLGNNLQIGSGEEAANFTVAPPDEAEGALADLDGTTWYLLSLYEQPLRDGTQITAQFDIDEGGSSGTIAGSAGCNSYSAAITGDLNISDPASSRQSCASPPGVMEQEGAYLAALAGVQSYTVQGNQLLLATPEGFIVYASQPAQPSTDQSALLRNVTWYLHSFGTTPASAAGDPATAIFSPEGTVSGNTGCNSFSGNYSTSGYSMEIGTLAVTRAACPPGLSEQESYMVDALQGAQNYLIASTDLQIRSGNAVLNFSSVPPAEDGGAAQLQAVMQAPAAAQVGEVVTFDATTSIHSRPIIKFIWNFGDGVQASGPVVQHAYRTEGPFVAELLISDDRGASATTTQQIVVSAAGAAPPAVEIQGPASAQVRETVRFTAAGGGESLQYTWYFGDGGSVNSGPVPEASYVYGAPGVYPVSVLVTAADGSSSASMEITISGGLEQTTWVWGNGPAPITMRFAGGIVSGFTGCNSYNATYTLEGNQLSITQPFAGDNQCPPDVMEQEQRFLSALPLVTTFEISGSTLTLTGGQGQSVILYAQN